MTPENELRIRANSRRKSAFAKLGMIMAANRVNLPEMKVWVDELSCLNMTGFPARVDGQADQFFVKINRGQHE